jgi:hypothetical protein
LDPVHELAVTVYLLYFHTYTFSSESVETPKKYRLGSVVCRIDCALVCSLELCASSLIQHATTSTAPWILYWSWLEVSCGLFNARRKRPPSCSTLLPLTLICTDRFCCFPLPPSFGTVLKTGYTDSLIGKRTLLDFLKTVSQAAQRCRRAVSRSPLHCAPLTLRAKY